MDLHSFSPFALYALPEQSGHSLCKRKYKHEYYTLGIRCSHHSSPKAFKLGGSRKRGLVLIGEAHKAHSVQTSFEKIIG